MKEIAPVAVSNPRIAVVASRFNCFIVDQLVAGVSDALERRGIAVAQQTLVWGAGRL